MAVLRDISYSYQSNSDFIARDVDPKVHLLSVRKRPLLATLVNRGLTFVKAGDGKVERSGTMLRAVPTSDADFIRWAEVNPAGLTSLTADANFTGASVTINVTSGTGKYFQKNDIIRLFSTSYTTPLAAAYYADYRISSVSTDAITTTTAANAPLNGSLSTGVTGLYVARVGAAWGQGDAGSAGVSETMTTVYNVLSDFRDPFEVSDIEAGSKRMYSNLSPLEEREIQAFQRHLDNMEAALIFGVRKNTSAIAASGGAVFNLGAAGDNNVMGGFQSYVTTNVTDAGDLDVTESEVIDFLATCQVYGSGNKIALAGSKMIAALQKMGVGHHRPQDLNTTPAIDSPMPSVTTMFGTVPVYYEPIFDIVGTKFGGSMLVVDTDNVELKYFSSPETKGDLLFQRREYLYASGATKIGGEYRSRISVKIANEKTHGWLLNGLT